MKEEEAMRRKGRKKEEEGVIREVKAAGRQRGENGRTRRTGRKDNSMGR